MNNNNDSKDIFNNDPFYKKELGDHLDTNFNNEADEASSKSSNNRFLNILEKIKNRIPLRVIIYISIGIFSIYLSYSIYQNFSIRKNQNKIFAKGIKKIGELGTIEVYLSDIYTSEQVKKKAVLLGLIKKTKKIKGLFHFHGKAVLGINMKKVKIEIVDSEKRVAIITLPDVELLSFKIEHDKTKEIRMSWNESFFANKITPKDISNFRHSSIITANETMKNIVEKDNFLYYMAKNRTELLITQFAKKLGWKITFDSNLYSDIKKEVKIEK